MQLLKLLDPLNNLSHHAYLLIGDSLIRDEIILILEKTYKIKSQGNSDFYIRNYETFTIDDSREIKSLHSSRPVNDLNKKDGGAGKKIFILTINGITVEAQNALLKLLEEPAEYAHFFLIIPSAHLLLSTVKSRMRETEIPITKKQDTKKSENVKLESVNYIEQANLFLKANQAKRLEIVKKLTDEISKDSPSRKATEERRTKTKQDAINFLNAIQEIIYKEKGVKDGKLALEAIETARNYLNDRAPSVKMLLEYVALKISN